MTADDLVPPPPRERFDLYAPDGTRLNVEVYGPDDAPTVLLVHGWVCSIGYWARQLNVLSQQHRVVAFDLRGHGASARPGPARYGITALADDLATVIESTVPAGQKAVVAAHSMGAMSLIALTDRHPHLLRAKVAAAAIISTGMHDLVVRSAIVPMPMPLAKLAHPVSVRLMGASPPRGRVDGRLRAFVKYTSLSRSATRAEVDFCTRIVASCPPRVRSGFARTLGLLDLDEQVTRFPVPAMVLAGERDRLTPIWHARRMAQALPNSLGLVEVPHHGHMLPIESPSVVNAAIRQLVRRHLAPPSAQATSPDEVQQEIA